MSIFWDTLNTSHLHLKSRNLTSEILEIAHPKCGFVLQNSTTKNSIKTVCRCAYFETFLNSPHLHFWMQRRIEIWHQRSWILPIQMLVVLYSEFHHDNTIKVVCGYPYFETLIWARLVFVFGPREEPQPDFRDLGDWPPKMSIFLSKYLYYSTTKSNIKIWIHDGCRIFWDIPGVVNPTPKILEIAHPKCSFSQESSANSAISAFW